jgi:ribonuclease-3
MVFKNYIIDAAKKYINRFILSDLENKKLFYDSKTTLQELMQGKLKKQFSYKLIEESGPEHDKTFKVQVIVEKDVISTGMGRTKKLAEQNAAYEALLILKKSEEQK